MSTVKRGPLRAGTVLAVSVILTALIYGCSDNKTEPAGSEETVTFAVTLPGKVPEGAQCAECGMYVEPDGKFTAEAVTADGRFRYFCDIGDMLIHLAKSGEGEIVNVNVRDYESGRWVNAYDAFYLADAPVRTPMRFGIAAFESRPDAEAFRAKNGGGTIYTYAGIQAEKPYE